MADFVPLARLLARDAAAGPAAYASEGTPVDASPARGPVAPPRDRDESTDVPGGAIPDAVARELGLLRLASLEAFERLTSRLLESFAAEVLGRELALAGSDVDALAARVLSQLPDLEPVALVLSPSDARSVRSGVPIRVDAALPAGDFSVDVRDGSIESTFAFRLASALERAAP